MCENLWNFSAWELKLADTSQNVNIFHRGKILSAKIPTTETGAMHRG